VAVGSVADFYLLEVLEKFYNYDSDLFNSIIRISENKRQELFDFIRTYGFNKGDENIKTKRENWIRYLTYECNIIELKNFFDFICRLERTSQTIKGFRILEKMNLLEIKAEISAGKGFMFEDYALMMEKYKEVLKKALSKKKDDFFFFDYIGKTSYSKTLSEELSYKLSDSKVIGVCFKKPNKDRYSCSFRGRDFVVNKMVEDCLKGLNGRGGGHPFAAGVSLHMDDYAIFKRRLNDYFDENK